MEIFQETDHFVLYDTNLIRYRGGNIPSTVSLLELSDELRPLVQEVINTGATPPYRLVFWAIGVNENDPDQFESKVSDAVNQFLMLLTADKNYSIFPVYRIG